MDRLLGATTVLSLALILLVLFSVRRAHIRVEYSVSWLAASFALLVLSRSQVVLQWIARFLGLSPPLALVLIVLGVFLLVFYRFSVIISDLKDANIALVQRLAILEFQMQSRHESQ